MALLERRGWREAASQGWAATMYATSSLILKETGEYPLFIVEMINSSEPPYVRRMAQERSGVYFEIRE